MGMRLTLYQNPLTLDTCASITHVYEPQGVWNWDCHVYIHVSSVAIKCSQTPVAVQHAPKEIRKPFKEACFLHRAGTGSVFPTPTSIYTLQEDFLHFCRKYYRYPKCTGTCMKVRHLVGLDFSTLYLLHKCRKISGTDTVKIWNYLKIFPALQPLYMVAFSPWFSFFWNMFGDNNSDGKLGSYVELQSNPTHITTRQ